MGLAQCSQGGHEAGIERALMSVMSDAFHGLDDGHPADPLRDDEVQRPRGPQADGEADLAPVGNWPVRLSGRRATWRIFVQTSDRRS